MIGTMEYVGESPFHHVMLRDQVKTVYRGEFINVPLNVCKKLWDSCLYVPDEETKDKINKFENVKTDDSYHVDGKWEGEEVFIIGSGSSMKGFDFSRLEGKKTIVVNHMVTEFPEASALLFFDREFVQEREKEIGEFKGLVFSSMRSGYKGTTERDFFYPTDTKIVPSKFNHGLHGKRSSLAALNLALVMGSRRVYLMGYDLIPYIENNYAFSPLKNILRANQSKYTKQSYCEMRIKEFEVFKKYKNKIYNCNQDSGIKMFKFADIEKVLS